MFSLWLYVCEWCVCVHQCKQPTSTDTSRVKNPASPLYPHRGLLSSNTSASSSNSILKIIKQIHLRRWALVQRRSLLQRLSLPPPPQPQRQIHQVIIGHGVEWTRFYRLQQEIVNNPAVPPQEAKNEKYLTQNPPFSQPPLFLRNPHHHLLKPHY